MKRSFFIWMIGIGLLVLGAGLSAQVVYVQPTNDKPTRDAYVDDSYYWPVVDTIVSTEPVYDRSAREFIFIEDTTQYPNTVRMKIVEK